MVSEPATGGTTEAARDAAHRYIAAGFSILPVRADKRPYFDVLPLGDDGERHWQHLTERLPTAEEVDYWFRKAPDAGVGLIMGPVSGGAIALDVDDGIFSNWVQGVKGLQGTWCNLTGSGKLHVIIRSPQAVIEHELKDPRDGRRLADVRGEGAYVVAPPSRYAKTGGHYTIWAGGPENVVEVAQPEKLWSALVESYVRGHSNGAAPHPPIPPSKHPKDILPPLTGPAYTALKDRISKLQSARARKAILDGVELHEPPWGAGDWSQLDWMIVKDLLRLGWTDGDIEQIWATFPIGLNCYQNARRADHGSAYLLDYTIPNARKALEEEREKAKLADGNNFHLLRAVCMHYDEPSYHLTFEFTDAKDSPVRSVQMTVEELFQERSFKKACFRDMDRLVELQGGHKGQGFDQLIKIISGVTEHVYPPRNATEQGQLREMVRQALKDRLDRSVAPEVPGDIRFGWIQPEERAAYVSGHALMAHFRQTQRHPPTPVKVWGVLEGIGARSRRLKIGDHSEEFWVVPLDALD